MSAAEGPTLLTEPLVVNSHNTQVEGPAEKLAMGTRFFHRLENVKLFIAHYPLLPV